VSGLVFRAASFGAPRSIHWLIAQGPQAEYSPARLQPRRSWRSVARLWTRFFSRPGFGQAPVGATVFELERLRCHLRGKVFKAAVPEEAGEEKYDETAAAVIALLKYGRS
jgi:hypothetical protein